MLLENKTKESFGYFPSDQSAKSGKPILLECDYCHTEYESSNKRREVAHRVIANDCCKKCKYKKMGEMNMLKYGVKNVFELNSVKEKIVSTNLTKYGVEYVQQNYEVREKGKQTCMEKYGVQNVLQSELIKDKIKFTNLERYGVENASSNEEVKERRKVTNLEKFGHEYYLGSEDCHNKMVNKFGVENVFQLEDIKQKSKETMINKYGVDHHMKVPEISSIAQEKGRVTKIELGLIHLHEGKTVEEWATIAGYSRSAFNTLINRYGWDIAVSMTPRMSSLEKAIEILLVDNGIKYQKQVKIGPYYADFVVGEIVIEADGLFWHSEHNKEDDYHVNKRHEYINNGYTPLFFREDEINKKLHVVKSIILNKLSMSEKLYARKLEVKEISKKDGADFLDSNHLMGKGRGRCFALLSSGEIVACLRMSQIEGGWDISRFATKCGLSVVGGFSRLISFFRRDVGNTMITTFIDLRYGTGNYLSDMGFKSYTPYKSFKWTDGIKTYHRMNFPSNTGYDHKLYKIWDCGQLKWVYQP